MENGKSSFSLHFSSSFSVFNSVLFFCFFKKFLIQKLLFIDFPLDYTDLEKFFKTVSSFSFQFSITALIKKKLISFYFQENFFFLNPSFRKNLCKQFYQKRPIIAILKRNVVPAKFPFLKQKEGKNLSFLVQGKKKFHYGASLQFLLMLKFLGLLSNDWNNQTLRVSPLGLKLFLKNEEKRFSRVLKKTNIGKKNYFHEILSERKGSFGNFRKKIFTQNPGCDKKSFDRWKLKGSLVNFFNRLNSSFQSKRKIVHCFFNKNLENFPLFHEIGLCFFPCLLDKVFYLRYSIAEFDKIFSKKSSPEFLIGKDFRIVVESNYRIYVYKKKFFSDLIFQLFSEPFYQIKNLFVGEITEKSVYRAFKKGVTSREILDFLERNLHEICPKIPKTVSDQIKVWEFQKKKNIFHESAIFLNRGDSYPIKSEIIFKLDKKKKFPKNNKSLILSKN